MIIFNFHKSQFFEDQIDCYAIFSPYSSPLLSLNKNPKNKYLSSRRQKLVDMLHKSLKGLSAIRLKFPLKNSAAWWSLIVMQRFWNQERNVTSDQAPHSCTRILNTKLHMQPTVRIIQILIGEFWCNICIGRDYWNNWNA